MDSPPASVVPLLFYPLSPRYISRRKLAAPGRGLILQRHQLLSTTGARDHIGVDDEIISINPRLMTPRFSTRTDRHSGLVDGVVQYRLF